MFEALKVTTEMDGLLAVVELDHGKANEVGTAVLRDLEKLTGWLAESGAVAAITYSRRTSKRGTPIFVSGANVGERVGWDEHRVKEHVAWQRSVLQGLKAAPVFHVAVVNGVALGWGTEYMLCCDWRIAASEATFGLPETGLGILPGAGGSADLWAHIGVAQTLRLGMTGERIGAEEAARIGLVQEVAADVDAGLARARSMAAMVAKKSPTALGAFKRAVLHSVGRDPEERVAAEAVAYDLCVDAGEAAIGRAAFQAILDGARPDWGPRIG
ncbi:MAG: enoyl-CoA hydratase/isomerase family protein [Alphaproteobacteria bacterium]|nr:enoyl-CoA hydratase/isomerase family protein [Alphaproteobacteria bacterium]